MSTKSSNGDIIEPVTSQFLASDKALNIELDSADIGGMDGEKSSNSGQVNGPLEITDDTLEVNDAEADPETDPEIDPELAKYDRFSERQKQLMVGLVSFTCFLTPMSSLAILPANDLIAAQFGTTTDIINISNTFYCICMAVSVSLLSPYADIYGRRYVFLSTSLIYTVGSVLVAVSQNLTMFYIFRGLTALGTAAFTVGASIISDIFPPTRRGRAMGAILLGSQLGPTIGPFMSGVIVTYTSWRVIFAVLAGLGAITSILALFLPETCAEPLHAKLQRETGRKFVFVPVNPFRVLKVLIVPNLAIAGFGSMAVSYNMYNLLTGIHQVVNRRFNLNTPIISSLFYLPLGTGYLVGSYLGGQYADFYVRAYIKKRGRRVPEDRLRSAILGLAFMLPGGILVYGWCLQKEAGGKAMVVLSLLVCGLAQTIYFPSINAYCVDCIPKLKSDAIASNYFARFVAGGLGSAFAQTQISAIGIGWSCTITALALELAALGIFVLIYYGERMRTGLKAPEGDADAT